MSDISMDNVLEAFSKVDCEIDGLDLEPGGPDEPMVVYFKKKGERVFDFPLYKSENWFQDAIEAYGVDWLRGLSPKVKMLLMQYKT